MPAGDYSWRGLYFGADAVELRGQMIFKIEPAKSNYTGNMLVEPVTNQNTGSRVRGVYRIIVIDDSQKARQEMKAASPEL